MRRLVYLSAVRWADFAQRPHKFAEWHHAAHGSTVLWVEPYPTRLPHKRDLQRLRGAAAAPRQAVPPWLEPVAVPALPIEPLPGATWVNARLWQPVLGRIAAFAAHGPCDLVIGKPSQLALHALRLGPFRRKVYDAMDDFPAFHGGLSARAVAASERAIARRVDEVYASSTRLRAKFAPLASRVALVRNACDPASLPPLDVLQGQVEPDLVGYIGTMASWFDWEMVLSLARARPQLRFRLIGPLHAGVPPLPANVELRPACAHAEAMREMARFAVGLIPFRGNRLTAAVDPVKYYEYRALGVPVLSTPFGEMPEHARVDEGVFLASAGEGVAEALDRALATRAERAWIESFRRANGWDARFAPADA